MSQYWKTLGLKRAPATHKTLDRAYNTRLERLIDQNDVEAIEVLHDAYKEGKAALERIVITPGHSAQTHHKAENKKVKRKWNDKPSDKGDEISLDDFLQPESEPISVARAEPTPTVRTDSRRPKNDIESKPYSEPKTKFKAKSRQDHKRKADRHRKKDKRKHKKQSHRQHTSRHESKTKKTRRKYYHDPLSFKAAIGLFYRKYFNFTSRSSRSEFWWPMLFIALVILFTLAILGVNLEITNYEPGIDRPMNLFEIFLVSFFLLFTAAQIIPVLSVTIRRARDHSLKRIMQFLGLTCVSAVIFFPAAIVFALLPLFVKGTKGPNRYGRDPLEKR